MGGPIVYSTPDGKQRQSAQRRRHWSGYCMLGYGSRPSMVVQLTAPFGERFRHMHPIQDPMGYANAYTAMGVAASGDPPDQASFLLLVHLPTRTKCWVNLGNSHKSRCGKARHRANCRATRGISNAPGTRTTSMASSATPALLKAFTHSVNNRLVTNLLNLLATRPKVRPVASWEPLRSFMECNTESDVS